VPRDAQQLADDECGHPPQPHRVRRSLAQAAVAMDQLCEIEGGGPRPVRVVPPRVVLLGHSLGLHLGGDERSRRIQAAAASAPEAHEQFRILGALQLRIEPSDLVQRLPSDGQVRGAQRNGPSSVDDEFAVTVILEGERTNPVVTCEPCRGLCQPAGEDSPGDDVDLRMRRERL
jgi:hypothetical protein